MNKTFKIKVNDQVAFNTLVDAVWFDVIEIKGIMLTIREHGTNYAVQYMDVSTVKQVRNSD